ncbi:threonine synthase [Rhodovibrio salinarum]|uniref:Tryptophan synthase beta chain-like PALP domain-containing protein n=1 Tax=Rhodovibrio salinarum TaxID=1087 RepID=A0A934QH64_9PROT|nr:pyridoxal-phosphate dependent enzyme [Rhodovibrio salinarum]MBK1696602.1 hypothetical protein [Rhodovibrio salinarum]
MNARETERLTCVACGQVHDIAQVPSTCSACGGILDLDIPGPEQNAIPHADEDTRSLWHWAQWLPDCAREDRVSLGEAGTPLLPCPRLAADSQLESLWIKNDSIMPTGSFKDRAIALAVSLARTYGRPGLVLSSSGNAGASAAAYAARAGMPVVVLVPATAPAAKLRQIAVTGAQLVTVDGATSDCCRLADELARSRGWVNLTTTFHNPYGVDAYATLAYEVAQAAPDVLLLPISSGPLLVGIMKGFARLQAAGLASKMPRPVAVQPTRCAPITTAWTSGTPVTSTTPGKTIASALSDTLEGYADHGAYTLSWLRRYDGACLAVDEDEIAHAVQRTARCEGIVLEPSAAAPIAAAPRLGEVLGITPSTRVMAVVTGHGLKDLSIVETEDLGTPIPPDFSALTHRIGT